MRTRLVTAAVLATGLAAFALPSSAATAPAPQIQDATGDSLAPVKGLDIVSGLFATSGTGTPGKKGYVPKSLVITITYAGDVATAEGYEQEVTFMSDCGAVKLQAYAGASYAVADCLADSFEPDVTVAGTTMTFTLPFGTFDGLKAGATLTDLHTNTTLGDPVVGLSLTDVTVEDASSDVAATTASYKIA